MKFCKKCQTTKLFSEFTAQSNSPDGLRYACASCIREQSLRWARNNKAIAAARYRNLTTEEKKIHHAKAAEWIKKNPEKVADRYFRKKYGITLEDYNRMSAQQAGLCKLCRLPETKLDQHRKNVCQLAVDHCHTTGKVRGLLCFSCNSGLGKFNDDPALLRDAINYLERPED